MNELQSQYLVTLCDPFLLGCVREKKSVSEQGSAVSCSYYSLPSGREYCGAFQTFETEQILALLRLLFV